MSLLKLNPDFKPAFDGPVMAQQLVHKVAMALPVRKAILFGSAAHQKNTVHSDLDILLIVPDSAVIKDYYKFVHQPYFSSVSVDWIIKTESDYVKEEAIGGVSMVASHTGIEMSINEPK